MHYKDSASINLIRGTTRYPISIEQIKVRTNGYLFGLGIVLKRHYKNLDSVSELIKLGDAFLITDKIDKPNGHSLKHPINGYSIFYGRDGGYPVHVRYFESYKDALLDPAKFNYFFIGGDWFYVIGDDLILRSSDILHEDHNTLLIDGL